MLPKVRGDLTRIARLTAGSNDMMATAARNGVLILVVPARREFHVEGDREVHEKVGNESWKSVVGMISRRFEEGDFTSGVWPVSKR